MMLKQNIFYQHAKYILSAVKSPSFVFIQFRIYIKKNNNIMLLNPRSDAASHLGQCCLPVSHQMFSYINR